MLHIDRAILEKWAPLLDAPNMPKIRDPFRRAVTASILENAEKAYAQEPVKNAPLFENMQHLFEAGPANQSAGYPTGNANLKGPEPVMIPVLRRAAPMNISLDLVGTQPMPGPVGLVFALKAKKSTQGNATELLFNEADTRFGASNASSDAGFTATSPLPQTDADSYKASAGMTTADGEALGASGGTTWAEVAFSIDKISVTAVTRAMKAEYTHEIQQDLSALASLDARAELMNILTQELTFEQNREVIRLLWNNAKMGAQQSGLTTAGEFDLDLDSNGRWLVEKLKGLIFQLERDANVIGQDTRRGRGNWIVCSQDLASGLSIAGLLDSSGLKDSLEYTGETENTYVGMLNGRFKVFVDPYVNYASVNYYMVGYKGASAYDAGIFYCPYVPLQMMETLDSGTFAPKIAFKTRYGLISNPFANAAGTGALTWNANKYYRKALVRNLM